MHINTNYAYSTNHPGTKNSGVCNGGERPRQQKRMTYKFMCEVKHDCGEAYIFKFSLCLL